MIACEACGITKDENTIVYCDAAEQFVCYQCYDRLVVYPEVETNE